MKPDKRHERMPWEVVDDAGGDVNLSDARDMVYDPRGASLLEEEAEREEREAEKG